MSEQSEEIISNAQEETSLSEHDPKRAIQPVEPEPTDAVAKGRTKQSEAIDGAARHLKAAEMKQPEGAFLAPPSGEQRQRPVLQKVPTLHTTQLPHDSLTEEETQLSDLRSAPLHEIVPHKEEEDEEEGIQQFMRERRILWGTMSRPQKLITGLAIGQLLGASLLLVLNYLLPFIIPIATKEGNLIGTSAVIFVAALSFFILAWSFLLTGALHGQILMRLLALGIFTGILFSTPVLPLMLPVRIGLLGTLWAWGVIIWVLEIRAKKRGTPLQRSSWGWPWPTFYPILALLIVYYTMFFGSFLSEGATEHATAAASASLFFQTITLQMESVAFFLIPILFLAGTDFAEFGEAIMESGIAHVNRRRPGSPWPLVLLTALVAGILVILNLPAWNAHVGSYLLSIFSRLTIGAVIVVVMVGVARLARITRWPALQITPSVLHVKARILVIATFLTAVLGVVIAPAVITAFVSVRHPVTYADAEHFAIYRFDHQPYFSLAYPSGWHPFIFVDTGEATWTTFDGTPSYPYSSFWVFRYTLSVDPQQRPPMTEDFQTFLANTCQNAKPACIPVLQPATTQGSWQVIRFTAEHGRAGIAWLRDDQGQRWFLYGYAIPKNAQDAESIFAVIVDSWRADTTAEVPNLNRVREEELASIQPYAIPLLNGVLPLLAALVVGVPLLFWGRRRPGLLTVAGVFFMMLGVLEFVHYFPSLLALSGLHLDQSDFNLPTLLLAVAVGTLLVLLWLDVRRKMTPAMTKPISFLFVLNGGLGFISFMYWVYDKAIAAGEGSYLHYFVLAALLLAALGWDIFTSGETTNVEGNAFPRHTRLLLFLGYTTLVSTAVLYFSSQKFIPPSNPDQAVQKFFDSETYPQLGLYILGIPLVITSFILKLYYWWGMHKATAAGEVQLHLPVPPSIGMELWTEPLSSLTPSNALPMEGTAPVDHAREESEVDPSKKTAQASDGVDELDQSSFELPTLLLTAAVGTLLLLRWLAARRKMKQK